MAEKDKVIGKALYAEFRSGPQTYQLMITPDGITSGGKYTPAWCIDVRYLRHAHVEHGRATAFQAST